MVRTWRMALTLAGLALLAVSAAGSSCAGIRPKPTPTTVDAGTVDVKPHATCAAACAHRATLKQANGSPCAFQSSCLDNCNGVGSGDFNDCMLGAVSCKAVDVCDPAFNPQ